MTELEKRLGYEFKNRVFLENALTHSSYANENKKSGAVCNERLEFLGDAVLGVTVAEYLYESEPDMPEGQMTRLRAELVCEKSLKSVAEELELGRYLRLGKGEELSGGRERASINADAVEAVIAAMYLDGGRERAAEFIKRFILSRIDEFKRQHRDCKTLLQEYVQRDGAQTLCYILADQRGPDHSKEFFVRVELNGTSIGEGWGKSKKEAEQSAAGAALSKLGANI